MNLITEQLKTFLPKNHYLQEYKKIDPQNIEDLIKTIKNKNKIKVYDLTKTQELQQLEIIRVNDHINKTGENPLIARQKQLKITFLDSTNLYKSTQDGIITECCGKKLNKNSKFPSHYLSNIALLSKAIGVKEFSAYLINVL